MQDQSVINELRRLEEKNGGRLLPQLVVKAARSKVSPLHQHFEWDDSAAAEKYRVEQARALIRVCVEYVGDSDNKRKINAFVSLTTDRNAGGGYRTMTRVLAMDSMRAQLIEDAKLEMDRFRAKFSSVTELAGVLSEMAEASRKLSGVSGKRKGA